MTTTKQKSRAETQNIKKREKTEKNIIEDYHFLAQKCKEKETMELQNNQKKKTNGNTNPHTSIITLNGNFPGGPVVKTVFPLQWAWV